MKQLKAEVERIVEPVRAEIRLKNKFRLELWAHLSELYEEESASTPDSEAAAHRALERLGKPVELRAQLRASMKYIDRIEGFGEYWMRPRAGVPLFREIMRLGITGFLIEFGLILAFVAGFWIAPKGLQPGEAWFQVALVASMGFITGAFVAMLGWVEGTIARRKHSNQGLSTQSLVGCAVSALLFLILGTAVHAAGHAFLASVLGRADHFVMMFDFVNSTIWLWFGGAMFIAMPIIILVQYNFSGRLPDWPYADAE